MEIEYGAEVRDKNDRVLGKVVYIVRDTYSGGIRKFMVGTDLTESDFFISPQDVLEATVSQIKLKIAFDELKAK